MNASIYFIAVKGRDMSPIKIGTSKNPDQRLSLLQAGSPDELYTIGVTAGSYKDEALIHRAFSGLHMRNEWFRYDAELEFFAHEIIRRGVNAVRVELQDRAQSGRGIRVKSIGGIERIRLGVARRSEVAA
ncbi:GIY-YIG nuclease family protein [Rhizobium favelukesii]|uniref:GIY-YIG nuclease family protein n=1 Tax=Rhizobium favelukesii TaxID=348824 RepID=UPI000563E78D|nr:GIY-YIG nuclease family protein [Rhizobium favelukesii]